MGNSLLLRGGIWQVEAEPAMDGWKSGFVWWQEKPKTPLGQNWGVFLPPRQRLLDPEGQQNRGLHSLILAHQHTSVLLPKAPNRGGHHKILQVPSLRKLQSKISQRISITKRCNRRGGKRVMGDKFALESVGNHNLANS